MGCSGSTDYVSLAGERAVVVARGELAALLDGILWVLCTGAR